MSQAVVPVFQNLLNQEHPLLKLCREIDWQNLEVQFAPQGVPSYSSRLMLGLQILRLHKGLSDEELCEHWIENPYFQAFCGEESFQHKLGIIAEEMCSWREMIGHCKLERLVPTTMARVLDKPANFVIDIDGVVAKLTPGNDYALSKPITEVVSAINRLYDRGHRIILLTARGTKTGINWGQVTREQFEDWGLKYHELHFGKPAGDYYVDDRMISIDMLCAVAAGREFPPSTKAPSIVPAEKDTNAQEGSHL